MSDVTVQLKECSLLTDTFAKLIQLALGCIAISALWIKRELETPKRPIAVWRMDVAKQGFGALFVHCLNLLLAQVFAKTVGEESDECGVYFITFTLDVTIGTFIVYFLLLRSEKISKERKWPSLEVSGEYGDPVSYNIWGKQMALWIGIQIVMKIAVTTIIYVFFRWISVIGTSIFSIFKNHRHFELLVVMIFGPCGLNAVQFWVSF